MNITLDGFMAGPNTELDWHFQSWNDEMARHACEQLSAMDTILLGRVTYQTMANYWPFETLGPSSPREDIAFADMMNNYKKIVFSRTLEKVDPPAGGWKNTRLVKENIKEEISEMKQLPGKDMIIYGSGGLVQSFKQLSLIDEFRFWVAPVAIGNGMPLFKGIRNRLNLKLLKTKQVSSGVVILYYQPGEK